MTPDEPSALLSPEYVARQRLLWRIWWAIVLFLVIGSFLLTGVAMLLDRSAPGPHGKRFYTVTPPSPAYAPTPWWSGVPEDVVRPTPVPGPGIVWVNTRSHIYHFPGYRWYGTTQQGKYVSERDAEEEGNRAALNERRPANFGMPTKK